MKVRLEHINITVSDPKRTVAMLEEVLGWHIRWEGPSKDNGYTYHVGNEDQYIAVYSNGTADVPPNRSYETITGLNHIALTVDDLEAIEAKVIKTGYTPINHADYEPGCRFYFRDHDNIEYEIVSYSV